MRLEGHWAILAELPRRALEKYKRYVASRLAQPSGRLRATAIHDFMIDELRTVFGHDVIKRKGRWLLRAKDVVLQFKKVDSKGRTSNYPTPTARAYETQLDLPGIPRGTRVTLGYRLNKDNTEVVEVCMVARDGDQIIWREEVQTNQETLPIRVSTPRPAAQKVQAKKEALESRGVKKKDKKDDSSGA